MPPVFRNLAGEIIQLSSEEDSLLVNTKVSITDLKLMLWRRLYPRWADKHFFIADDDPEVAWNPLLKWMTIIDSEDDEMLGDINSDGQKIPSNEYGENGEYYCMLNIPSTALDDVVESCDYWWNSRGRNALSILYLVVSDALCEPICFPREACFGLTRLIPWKQHHAGSPYVEIFKQLLCPNSIYARNTRRCRREDTRAAVLGSLLGSAITNRGNAELCELIISSNPEMVSHGYVLRCHRRKKSALEMAITEWQKCREGRYIKSYPQICRVLLSAGADPNHQPYWSNKKNELDFFPLHFACHRGNVELFKILVDAGADINRLDTVGRAPLFYAKKGGEANAGNCLKPPITRGCGNSIKQAAGRQEICRRLVDLGASDECSDGEVGNDEDGLLDRGTGEEKEAVAEDAQKSKKEEEEHRIFLEIKTKKTRHNIQTPKPYQNKHTSHRIFNNQLSAIMAPIFRNLAGERIPLSSEDNSLLINTKVRLNDLKLMLWRRLYPRWADKHFFIDDDDFEVAWEPLLQWMNIVDSESDEILGGYWFPHEYKEDGEYCCMINVPGWAINDVLNWYNVSWWDIYKNGRISEPSGAFSIIYLLVSENLCGLRSRKTLKKVAEIFVAGTCPDRLNGNISIFRESEIDNEGTGPASSSPSSSSSPASEFFYNKARRCWESVSSGRRRKDQLDKESEFATVWRCWRILEKMICPKSAVHESKPKFRTVTLENILELAIREGSLKLCELIISNNPELVSTVFHNLRKISTLELAVRSAGYDPTLASPQRHEDSSSHAGEASSKDSQLDLSIKSCSSMTRHEEICKMLLSNKADPNQEIHLRGRNVIYCKGGKVISYFITCPLHEACRLGQRNICKMLVDAKADVNRLDRKGKKPMYYMRDFPRDDIWEQRWSFLIDAGACEEELSEDVGGGTDGRGDEKKTGSIFIKI